MQKRRFLMIALLNLMISIFCIAGCNIGFILVEKVEVKNSQTIEMTMGEFDCSDITLIVSYSDRSKEEVPLTMDMIPTVEQMKFFKEGEQTVKVVYRDHACYLNVLVSRSNFDSVSLVSDTVTYDGKVHSLSFSEPIPENASIVYPNGNSFTDVGEYEVKAIISCTGYETIETTGTLVIEKATYDMSEVVIEDKSYVYDGMSKSFTPDNLPNSVKVSITYYSADGRTQINAPSLAGEYLERIRFISSNANYNVIPDRTIKLTINKAQYSIGDLQFNDEEVDYNGQSHFVKIGNSSALPKEVSARYEYYYLGFDFGITTIPELTQEMLVEEPTDAGIYIAKAVLTSPNPNYEIIPSAYAKLTIKAMEISLSHVKVNSSVIDFDNETHSVGLVGNLPSSVGVKYSYNGEEVEGVRRIGTYKIVASFYFLEETANTVLVPSSITGNLIINKIDDTIKANPVFVYDDEASALEDKYTVSGIPDDVNYSIRFKQNGETVLSNELRQGNTYDYVISYNYKDEVRNEGVKLASQTGSIHFRYIVKLSDISMQDEYFIGSQSSYSIYAEANGIDVPDDLFIYTNNDQTETGEYTVVATINEEKYEIRWTTVGEHLTQLTAKMYIITDPFGVTFDTNNIVYVDSADPEVDKFRIQGIDLNYYNVDLSFVNDATNDMTLGCDIQRDVVYRYQARINIQNEEVDKLGTIPLFEGTVRFKVLLKVANIPITDTDLTYNGNYQDVKVSSSLPDDAYVYYVNGNKSVGKLSLRNVGEYNVTVRYNTDVYDFNYAAGANSSKDFKVTVAKMVYLLPQGFITDKTFVYDGKVHQYTPDTSALPSSITVKYEYKFKYTDAKTSSEKEIIESGARRVGVYEVTVTAQTPDTMIDVSQAVQTCEMKITFDLKERLNSQFVYNYKDSSSSTYLTFKDEYYGLSFKSQTSKNRSNSTESMATENFLISTSSADFIAYNGTWMNITYSLTQTSVSRLSITTKESIKMVTLSKLISDSTIIYDGLTHTSTYDAKKLPANTTVSIGYTFEYTNASGVKQTITTDTSMHRIGTYTVKLTAVSNDENVYLLNSIQTCNVKIAGVTLEEIEDREHRKFTARASTNSTFGTDVGTHTFKDKLLGLTFTTVKDSRSMLELSYVEDFFINADNEDFIAFDGAKARFRYTLIIKSSSQREVLEIGENGRIVPVNGNYISNQTIVYNGTDQDVTINTSLFGNEEVTFEKWYYHNEDKLYCNSLRKLGSYSITVGVQSANDDVFFPNGIQTCTATVTLAAGRDNTAEEQAGFFTSELLWAFVIHPQTKAQTLVLKDNIYGVTFTSVLSTTRTEGMEMLPPNCRFEQFVISTTNEDLSMLNGQTVDLMYEIDGTKAEVKVRN